MDRGVGNVDALRDGGAPAQRCAGSQAKHMLTGSKSRGGNLKVLQVDVLARRDGDGAALTKARVGIPEVFCVADHRR